MAAPRIAFKTSMELTGLESLMEKFNDIGPREARNLARSAVHALAGKVRDRMKQRVVKRSGELAKSIKAVRRKGKPDFPVSDVRGGSTAPYMLMPEFGTSDTPAQPFIVPTVEEMRGSVPEHYRDEFGKKYEKAMAKRAGAGKAVKL